MSYTAVLSVQAATIIESIYHCGVFIWVPFQVKKFGVLTSFWGDSFVAVLQLNLNLIKLFNSFSKSLFIPTGLSIPHNEHNFHLFLLSTE